MNPEPMSSETWAAALRSMGRRVTRQRLAVLEAAHRHPHASAETILAAARTELAALTAPSVYQVLSDLTEWGLLRKLEPPDSPARYETRIDDNHHHVMCTRCGAMEDVSCVVGHAPCLTPAHTSGMRIESAEVLFRGTCAACVALETQAPAPEPAAAGSII
ncbi:Fur family transcriptional regulator [Ruania halotolerans]|uniref:Fur family transcriptional regulator n=1 Tax=Ruania halotolerans TaxID=2897773 RepID=UPI001E2B4ED8|nr:Fur family transcriptional regulator [Ruania halotolerans]UFU06515.1 transcriptional repressor [Ruania halotolerans]